MDSASLSSSSFQYRPAGGPLGGRDEDHPWEACAAGASSTLPFGSGSSRGVPSGTPPATPIMMGSRPQLVSSGSSGSSTPNKSVFGARRPFSSTARMKAAASWEQQRGLGPKQPLLRTPTTGSTSAASFGSMPPSTYPCGAAPLTTPSGGSGCSSYKSVRSLQSFKEEPATGGLMDSNASNPPCGIFLETSRSLYNPSPFVCILNPHRLLLFQNLAKPALHSVVFFFLTFPISFTWFAYESHMGRTWVVTGSRRPRRVMPPNPCRTWPCQTVGRY